MKILILTPDIYTRGGIARYTATLASAMGSIVGRENVHVITLFRTGEQDEIPKGFRVLGTVTDRLTQAAKARFGAKALWRACRGYDLMICSHVALAPIAAFAQRIFHTPFWVACHDAEVWRRVSPARLAAIRRAQFVLPVSRFTARMLSEINGLPREKMRVLRNAIPDPFAEMLFGREAGAGSPLLLTARRYILSVGSLARAHEYKGFDTVIRTLPRLTADISELHYVIVGDGDHRPQLEFLSSQLGIQDRVIFRGRVSNRELAELYRGCAAFVMPSRASTENGRPYGEGFGRVYVEAAMAGRPVVGSTCGGAAEAVLHGRTGFLVDPTSVSEVSAALSMLLQSPELALKMGQEGRCWAGRNFSEATLRSELENMLRESGHIQ